MSLARCTVVDLIGFESARTTTPEGYVIAPANIARTGIQVYSARELGMKDGNGNRTVRLYRPAGEVFHPEAIKSFEAKPIADNHPEDDITAENWDKFAVGDVHDVAPNGTYLGAQSIFRKKSAIDKLSDGKVELSCGYSFDADMTPGRTADGEAYDGVMRTIRGNHVALVDMARGGPGCRVADRDPTRTNNDNGGYEMDPTTTTTMKLGGVTIRVLATDAQPALDAFERQEQAVKDAKTACEKAITALDASTKETEAQKARAVDAEGKLVKANEEIAKVKTASEAKDAAHVTALAELQAKVPTEAQIEARAAERADVVAGATKVVGDSFKPAGKTIAAIRSEVVAHVIAKDEAIKPIALAILRGVALDKTEESKVSDIFAAVVAAKGSRATDSRANDGIGRLLAHDDGNGNQTVADGEVLDLSDPHATLKFRGNHGGKSAAEEKDGAN